MCAGVAPTVDCGRKYWIAWEQGMLGATSPTNPVIDVGWFCDHEYVSPFAQAGTVTAPAQQQRGFGDLIASALSTVGITEERVAAWVGGECNCAARREKLNRLGEWAKSLIAGSPTEEITQMLSEDVPNES